MNKYFYAFIIAFLVVVSVYFILKAPLRQSSTTKEQIVNVDKGNLPPLGTSTAKVIIIEFGDYLCPFCGRTVLELYPQLENLINQGKVVLYYRDFIVHPQAFPIANSARCANEQGKFWEYNKEIFKMFMSGQETKTKESWLNLAKSLNLDLKKFEKCVDENRYLNDVQKDTQEAVSLGARGTPTFFINGQMVEGIDIEKIWSIINNLLK